MKNDQNNTYNQLQNMLYTGVSSLCAGLLMIIVTKPQLIAWISDNTRLTGLWAYSIPAVISVIFSSIIVIKFVKPTKNKLWAKIFVFFVLLLGYSAVLLMNTLLS